MLTYNNHLSRLVLPEYGRNIQNMVDRALEIEDRDTRTAAASTIVDTMFRLFPPSGPAEEYRRKLWDHVIIMSGYRLDVDSPFGTPVKPAEDEHPDPLFYNTDPARRRHYGRLVELSVAAAADMPEGEERDALLHLVANQMKKLLMAINPEGVENERVYRDLYEMSDGRIRVDAQSLPLHEYNIIAPPSGKKKKKRK
ncbi:MAG: DUF4290 domain-containing protein [Muribaculaceae bacterium]|nr:DUF4290 domain-containing protein [Muribaculaceae bacterium]